MIFGRSGPEIHGYGSIDHSQTVNYGLNAPAGPVEKSDLDNLLNTNRDMALCRDLANAYKHYSLTRPSNDPPPSVGREYVPGQGNISDDTSYVVLSGGEKHDLVELAGRIVRAWKDFVEVHVK